MATNPFETVRNKTGDTEKSVNWYQQQVKKLAGLTPANLMKSGELVNRITPGNMYMFFYDAKNKDKLPYWDKFPLVLPFRAVQGGFYGINLHYMPYLVRYKLLGRLHDYVIDIGEEDRRIAASWKVLVSLSNVAPVKFAVKHYLHEQVNSRFMKIKYTDWVIASQLPVEKFEGANKTDIWKQSRNFNG